MGRYAGTTQCVGLVDAPHGHPDLPGGAVADRFPTAQRYTGLSVGCNIGAALFGGTASLIATLLIEWSGNVSALSFCIIFCATVSLAVTLTLRNRVLIPSAP